METLHVRAEHRTIEVLMDVINKISQNGQEIEILDNTIYNQEQQEQIIEHDELWNDLLK